MGMHDNYACLYALFKFEYGDHMIATLVYIVIGSYQFTILPFEDF